MCIEDIDEDPREWSDAQVETRINAFAVATTIAASNPYDKGVPAEVLKKEAAALPRTSRDALIRGAAALVIDKIEHDHPEAGVWCSLLNALLGIDWLVEENSLCA